MVQARKFLFDVSFDQPDPPPGASALPPEPTFSQTELDAARGEGFALGQSAAREEAAAATETRVGETLQALDRGLDCLNAAHDEIGRATERMAVALLRDVLRQAVPALCRKEAFGELEALVVRCLAETIAEPRLVLRVNDALFDAMQSRIGALGQANGYAGKIVLLADETLGVGDGRIEWADGGAERDPRRMLAEIDAALARILAASPETPRLTQENNNG